VDAELKALVRKGAQVTKWLGVVTAHDPDDAAPIAPDHVPGANSSADTLARATVRLPARRALDLGTGCGIQALLAARHAEHVVAVDVNPRAARFAALNARLNGIANVEVRVGSWLEPVAGERFDLVVCNPPYVLSPDQDFLYRDGGPGLAERLVRAIPAHLEEGGLGHVLCDWATTRGESPWAPVEAWTRDAGCDALTVTFGAESPEAYVEHWAPQERADAWLASYREAEVEAIRLGLVILRRRSGTNWFRGLGAPDPTRRGFASEHLLRVLAAQDRLAAGGVRGERFRVAPKIDAREEGDRVALTAREGLGVAASVPAGDLRGDDPAVLHAFELGLLVPT
jgi:SAM-dependent methyltransferase